MNRETSLNLLNMLMSLVNILENRISFYVTLMSHGAVPFMVIDMVFMPLVLQMRASGFLACHNLLLAHGMAMPILRKNAKNHSMELF